MFSIYAITGQTFRSTQGQIIQVPGVTPSRHARGIVDYAF